VNKKGKISLVIILVVFVMLLVWAPWMTNDWCKKNLIGYKFDSLETVSDEWKITSDWIPFGRKITARIPDFPPDIVGSWGFMGFMSFWGNLYGVVGG
jgi:hypothetical protein